MRKSLCDTFEEQRRNRVYCMRIEVLGVTLEHCDTSTLCGMRNVQHGNFGGRDVHTPWSMWQGRRTLYGQQGKED